MQQKLNTWIIPSLTLVLLLALATGVGGQTPDPDPAANASADLSSTLDQLRAMAQDERFETIRAMDVDERLKVLGSLSRQERKGYYAFGRPTSPNPPAADGYQPLEEPRKVKKPLKVAGTSIQYDSGTVTGTFTALELGRMVGNRYGAAFNGAGTSVVPLEQTGTVTMITFEMVNTFNSSAIWSLYDGISGTAARQVTSMAIGVSNGLNTFTINPASTMNVYQDGEFLAGIWQFVVGSTAVGIDTNSAGLGLNLHTIADPVTMSPNTGMNLRDVGGANAVFRVSGNLVTPVELMDFKIE